MEINNVRERHKVIFISRKTDFIVMGMPKCATTSFWLIMRQHSQVEFPVTGKHAMYYKKFKSVKAFEKKYWGKMQETAKHGFCAEMWDSNLDVKEMSKVFHPKMKIIFILRNPVERAYSEYKYSYGMDYKNFNIRDSIEFYKLSHADAFDRYVNRNLNPNKRIFIKYYEYIAPFLRYFGEDRVKIILFEEMMQDKETIYKEIFDFLEIEEEDCPFGLKANEGGLKPLNFFAYLTYRWFVMNLLYPFTDRIRTFVYRKEVSLYCDGLLSYFMKKLLCEDDDRSQMLSRTYRKLQKYYIKDCKKLSRILGRDVQKIWFA